MREKLLREVRKSNYHVFLGVLDPGYSPPFLPKEVLRLTLKHFCFSYEALRTLSRQLGLKP